MDMQQNGVVTAIIVDDGVDPSPLVSDLGNVDDEWSVFWADLKAEDNVLLDEIYPEHKDLDAEALIKDQAFVTLMFERRRDFSGNALDKVFEAFLANQQQVRKFIDAATAKLKAAAPAAVLARRAAFNASASGAANLAGEDDLVAAVEAGRVDLDSVKADMLPAPLRAMDIEARKRYVTEQSAARAALKSEIGELAKERDAFIARELEAEGGDETSFGARIYDTVRRQAAEVGLEYDAAARH